MKKVGIYLWVMKDTWAWCIIGWCVHHFTNVVFVTKEILTSEGCKGGSNYQSYLKVEEAALCTTWMDKIGFLIQLGSEDFDPNVKQWRHGHPCLHCITIWRSWNPWTNLLPFLAFIQLFFPRSLRFTDTEFLVVVRNTYCIWQIYWHSMTFIILNSAFSSVLAPTCFFHPKCTLVSNAITVISHIYLWLQLMNWNLMMQKYVLCVCLLLSWLSSCVKVLCSKFLLNLLNFISADCMKLNNSNADSFFFKEDYTSTFKNLSGSVWFCFVQPADKIKLSRLSTPLFPVYICLLHRTQQSKRSPCLCACIHSNAVFCKHNLTCDVSCNSIHRVNFFQLHKAEVLERERHSPEAFLCHLLF